MSDLERRLRAAMIAASEQPPANLMQEVRRRHRAHIRKVSFACVAVAAVIAIAAPNVAHALRAGNPAGGRPAVSSSAGPSSGPATPAASDCQGSSGALVANWRHSSLHVGPVWFAYDRPQGYVHLGGPAAGHRGGGTLTVGTMIVEVDYGARAVLTVAPSARSYFRLLNGFTNGSGPYPLSAGVNSLTLVGCGPGTPAGDNGRVTDYYLGFVITIGSDALVDVQTSAAARPIPVIFTCLRVGCDT